MRRVEIARSLAADEIDRQLGFLTDVGHGVAAISDHLRLDLQRGGTPGFAAITIDELAPGDDAPRLIGRAQLSTANDATLLEVAIDDAIDDAAEVRRSLVSVAVDTHRRDGGGALTWWVDDATTDVVDLAAVHGLHPVRALHEMRRSLPHPDRADITTRAFRPGVDDAAWLAVNNRAFAEHGEQGGWTASTLATRLSEPWFDADGFRVLDATDVSDPAGGADGADGAGVLAGFCWTKVHTDHVPPLGEIYVIAVDPSHHGRGLGRQLTLAGLDWLADHGLTLASLYVDAGNTAAVHLYERLGFRVHRTRTAFAGTLEPVPDLPAGAPRP